MKFCKQYPQIVLLLTFSICLLLFGIGLFYANSSKIYDPVYLDLSLPDEPPPPIAVSNNKKSGTSLREIGQAKSTYYPHTNDTITTTNFSFVYSDNRYRINMQSFFETPGKRVLAPANIKLRFIYDSKDIRFIDDFTLRIIIDDKTVFDKKSILESRNEDKYRVSLYITQEVPYALFVRMAKEKNVKMQVGRATFELKDYNLQTFRDLLKLIEP